MKRTVITLFLTLLSFSAFAEFKPHDISRFEPTVPGDKPVVFKSTDQPVVAVQNDEFATVNYGKTELCPAGGYYLVNIKRRTYQFVDPGSCSAGVKVTLETVPYVNKSIKIQRLTFYVGDEITARYPLYGY